MSPSLLAMVARRVILIDRNDEFKQDSEVGYVGLVFATRFAAQSPATTWKRWCCVGDNCHIQFHMRYLGITLADEKRDDPLFGGLLVHRTRHSVSGPHSNDGEKNEKDQNKVALIEMCTSTAVIATTKDTQLSYRVTTLTDSDPSCEGSGRPWDQFGKHTQRGVLDEIGMNNCGAFAGTALFQVEVYQLLRRWSQERASAIDQLDTLVNAKVCSVCP